MDDNRAVWYLVWRAGRVGSSRFRPSLCLHRRGRTRRVALSGARGEGTRWPDAREKPGPAGSGACLWTHDGGCRSVSAARALECGADTIRGSGNARRLVALGTW